MFATLAVLAALCFAVGGYFTKLSLGLTARGPTAMMFALFLASSALQAVAMRNEPMAVTYVIVLGLDAVTALLLSIWLLQETASAIRFGGIALVVAGIILLRGSGH
jgi:quaternary ammonium compound-resistance protein SugE